MSAAAVAGCVMCERVAGQGDLFIADLEVSRAYLNADQFFPGWAFVVLRDHVTELYDLDGSARGRLMEDVTRVARALAAVYRPVKMNYELLGNEVPHIHWHLIPRLPGDPALGRPVWHLEHPPQPLAPADLRARIVEIRGALAGAL